MVAIHSWEIPRDHRGLADRADRQLEPKVLPCSPCRPSQWTLDAHLVDAASKFRSGGPGWSSVDFSPICESPVEMAADSRKELDAADRQLPFAEFLRDRASLVKRASEWVECEGSRLTRSPARRASAATVRAVEQRARVRVTGARRSPRRPNSTIRQIHDPTRSLTWRKTMRSGRMNRW